MSRAKNVYFSLLMPIRIPDESIFSKLEAYGHKKVAALCTLGATIKGKTINKLKCSIIAGSANNQLEDENNYGQLLLEKVILFAPDYVINSGGIINCYSELVGFSKNRTLQLTENIYEATRNV